MKYYQSNYENQVAYKHVPLIFNIVPNIPKVKNYFKHSDTIKNVYMSFQLFFKDVHKNI